TLLQLRMTSTPRLHSRPAHAQPLRPRGCRANLCPAPARGPSTAPARPRRAPQHAHLRCCAPSRASRSPPPRAAQTSGSPRPAHGPSPGNASPYAEKSLKAGQAGARNEIPLIRFRRKSIENSRPKICVLFIKRYPPIRNMDIEKHFKVGGAFLFICTSCFVKQFYLDGFRCDLSRISL